MEYFDALYYHNFQPEKAENQAFVNYNFSYTRFRAHKVVLAARPCTWEIVHVTNSNMIRRKEFRNCTTLVSKPLAAKNGLSISVLCIAPFL